MSDNTVSIIVAIYNSAPFLPMLFDSFRKQTYENLEIVLVDDGSPDESGVMCDEFAAVDNRVKVIHKENGGTCEARNVGLQASTGNWIMVVDGDDWLEPDCVEYLLNIATSTNSDMAYSLNIFTTRDRQQIDDDVIEVWTSERATAAIIYPYMKLGPWNKIYKREVIDSYKIDFDVPWFGEGLYFATTCAQRSNHVGVGRRKVYNYRLNNEGSGLTKYNVQNGRNAVYNIEHIRANLIINTPNLQHAADWHLWRNYEFLLTQIIGTGTQKQYSDEYRECIAKVRKNWLKVFLNSDVNRGEKIKIICAGLFPVTYAKLLIRRNAKALASDVGRFLKPDSAE